MKSPARRRSRQIEGDFIGTGMSFSVIVPRFNEYITEKLLEGCENTLLRHGVSADRIEVCRVPGAFEIPTAAKRIAARGGVDAIICLGCVIRGSTSHFDHVCRETAKGISEVGRRTGVPTIFGVLTCDTLEQAIERAGTKMGNAGRDAALSGLEMASLVRKIG
jgi:6,7-dimethyl-8-ribityllumazine synthase